MANLSAVRSLLASQLRGLGSLVAPLHCAVCRSGVTQVHRSWGFALCRSCAGKLERIDGACRRCGASRGPHALSARRCPRCREHQLSVGRTLSLLRYRGAGRRLLHRVKYRGRQDAAAPLGRALAARARAVWPACDDALVVAVPLHWRRRRERGFDQAEQIAEGFAGELGLPLIGALKRRRHTAPLFGVAPKLRGPLLEGVFGLRLGARRRVRGRPVILVDDIRTSGATLEAAAAALKEAGATRLWAAVVAR